jgi:type VI secretion system protein ImpH
VIAHLFEEPYRYEFFQAVRLIELWLRRHGVAPERVLTEFVRFQNSVSLSFPPSDIEALSATTVTRTATPDALPEALCAGEPVRIHIRPAFMGFLGVNGALPLHYSERVAAWQHERKDEGPRAFFDMFSSRSLALFYQAWAKYRVEFRGDGDGFLPMLLAFAGVAQRKADEAAGDDEIGDYSLAWFAAQLRSRVVSGAVLAGVLGEYFQVPVAIEQFAGRWDVLEERQRTRLAAVNCTLGSGATLGGRLLRPDLGIRVRVGPVNRADFERFLPGRSASRALARLLGMFAIEVPHRELQVVLRAPDVRSARLDEGARLGLDCFLAVEDVRCDRGDVCYGLNE